MVSKVQTPNNQKNKISMEKGFAAHILVLEYNSNYRTNIVWYY